MAAEAMRLKPAGSGGNVVVHILFLSSARHSLW
jgi:hypothetical protein